MKKFFLYLIVFLASPIATASADIIGSWESRILASDFPFWSYGRVYFDIKVDSLQREVVVGQHRFRSETWQVLERTPMGARFQVESGQIFTAGISLISADEMEFCVGAFCSIFQRLPAMPPLRSGEHAVPTLRGAKISWTEGGVREWSAEAARMIFPTSYADRLGRNTLTPLRAGVELNLQSYLIDADPQALESYAFSAEIAGVSEPTEPQRATSGALEFSLPTPTGMIQVKIEFRP